jgi:hypothetical protein
MVKGMLQKQMSSVAEQQQRLNKVRTELEKLEVVRATGSFRSILCIELLLISPFAATWTKSAAELKLVCFLFWRAFLPSFCVYSRSGAFYRIS